MVSDRENEFQISAVSHIYLLAFFGLKKSFDMILNLIQEISWDTRHDKHE